MAFSFNNAWFIPPCVLRNIPILFTTAQEPPRSRTVILESAMRCRRSCARGTLMVVHQFICQLCRILSLRTPRDTHFASTTDQERPSNPPLTVKSARHCRAAREVRSNFEIAQTVGNDGYDGFIVSCVSPNPFDYFCPFFRVWQ